MNVFKEVKKNNWIFFVLIIVLVLIDQLTKLIVKNYFESNDLLMHKTGYISIIGDFLQFTYTENPGMAFSISFGPAKFLLSIFSFVAGFALCYYLAKIKDFSNWIKLGIVLITAAAFGNGIDRVFYGLIFGYDTIFYGKVIDFILVDIPDIDFAGLNYTHWPVFNIADALGTLGVAVLLIFSNKIPSFTQVFKKVENQSQE